MKVTRYQIEPPIPIDYDGQVVGIDLDTVNLGIADYAHGHCYVRQVEAVRSNDAVTRIVTARILMSQSVNYFIPGGKIIIEGSAFGAIYRQVELGEIRASFALWGVDRDFDVQIVPPNTIRKIVFGNGKTKAQEIWSGLPNDALASLSALYYGLK